MRDTSWYRTGTVSVASGSNVVTGTGIGSWTKNISVGDVLLLDQKPYQVLTVADDNLGNGTITTVPAYAGTGITNGTYAIIRSYTETTPADLALRVAEMLQTYHVTMDQLMTWMTGGGDGSLQSMTLDGFAGVSGLVVPTLPNLAPLSMMTSVTPAPNKIPKADENGKLDPNWLPSELLNNILNAGTGTGSTSASTTTSAERLLQLYPRPGAVNAVINSKDARYYDVFIGNDFTPQLTLNWVNTAPSASDPLHSGVPTNAVITLTVRVVDLTGNSSITWSGMPIQWAGGSAPTLGTTHPGDARVFQFRWLNTAGIPGLPVQSQINCWLGNIVGLSGGIQP